MASQAEIARHLDLSQAAVSQLIGDSVLPAAPRGEFDVDACRLAYIRHLRKAASGRSGSEGEKTLTAARVRVTAARAEALELKNAVARRELLPAQEVTAAVHAAFSRVRARLLGLPARAAPILVGIAAMTEIQDKLMDLVYAALRELALTGVEGVAPAAAEPGNDRGGSELVAGSGAATEADGERVGRRRAPAKSRSKRRTRRVEHGKG